MSFIKQAGLTLLTRGGILVITFVYNILLSRTLGADGMGIVGTLGTFVNVAVQIGNLGLSASAIYFIGLDKNRASSIAGTITSIGLILSVFLSVIFAILPKFAPGMIGNLDFLLYVLILVSIAPTLLTLYYQNLLLAHQKIAEYNWIELFVRFLSLVAAAIIIAVVDKPKWIPAIVWLMIGHSFLLAIIYAIYVGKFNPFNLRIDWSAFREMMAYGWKPYYSYLMLFLIVRSDIIFLNAWRSEAEAGIYRQVVYVSDLVYLTPMTLQMLLFPKLMQYGASDQTGADDRAHFTMLIARLVGFMMLALWIIFLCIGKWFLGIFGPEFTEGYWPLIILLVGIGFRGVVTILVVELSRRGMPIFVVVYSTVILLVKILGNILLIPRFGTYGAAWSSLVTQVVFFMMVLWFCVKYYGFTVQNTLFVKIDDFKLLYERIGKALNRSRS